MRCCTTLLLSLVCGITEERMPSGAEPISEERLPVGAVHRLGDVRYWWKSSCSADGRTLISAGADGTIRLWDASEKRQWRVFEDRKADFCSLAFSPDGRTIVAMDAGGEITIRTDATKEREQRLASGPRSLFDPGLVKPPLGFSADGRITLAGRKVWQGGFDKAPHTLRADRDESDPVQLSPREPYIRSEPEALAKFKSALR